MIDLRQCPTRCPMGAGVGFRISRLGFRVYGYVAGYSPACAKMPFGCASTHVYNKKDRDL